MPSRRRRCFLAIDRLTLLFSVSLLAVALTAGRMQAASPEQPNVIIVYTDDQGSVDANCYGSEDLITPSIDQLAATGVRFTQMLAPSAICSASRAGLLSGRFPARAGVPAKVSSAKGNAGMPPGELTIAELLKGAGYRTHHVGKWHLGYTPETMPLGQGFDSSFGHMGGCIDNYSHFFYWNGPNRHDLWRDGKEVWHDGEYFGDLMVDEMKRVIDLEGDEPFFVYWAINWPHYPLQGTEEWRQAYAERNLPSPRDKYAIFMSSTDSLLGAILDHLDQRGIRDETLVIFQSDHGHSVEERTFHGGGSAGPYRGHKGNLFEGGLRVPSIVSLPGRLPEGEVREQLVTGCDWWPTIAELCGVDLPSDLHLDGKSIVPVIESAEADSPHASFYWQLGGNPKSAQWVVREGDWKLIGKARENVRPDGVKELTAEDKKHFLVNLAEDPGETRNVAAEQPEVLKRLQALASQYGEQIQEHRAD